MMAFAKATFDTIHIPSRTRPRPGRWSNTVVTWIADSKWHVVFNTARRGRRGFRIGGGATADGAEAARILCDRLGNCIIAAKRHKPSPFYTVVSPFIVFVQSLLPLHQPPDRGRAGSVAERQRAAVHRPHVRVP